MTFRRKVKPGLKLGRKIGFPTLNFNVGDFGQHVQPGVYHCQVFVEGKPFKGALFYGSKMGSLSKTLEIFVLGFSGKIYGQFVRFTVGKKIRAPKKFASLESLKGQIKKDVRAISTFSRIQAP